MVNNSNRTNTTYCSRDFYQREENEQFTIHASHKNSHYNKFIAFSIYLLIILRNIKDINLFHTTVFKDKKCLIFTILKIVDTIFMNDKKTLQLYTYILSNEFYLAGDTDQKDLINEIFEGFLKNKLQNIALKKNEVYSYFLSELIDSEFRYEIKDYTKEEKSWIYESVLRVIFSKGKNLHLERKIKDGYELTFIKLCVNKSVNYYYKKFGNGYKNLFRDDIIWDFFIKHFKFVFGNCIFFKTHSKYLNYNTI